MDVCSCDVVLGNTGKPGCKRTYLVTKFLILTALVGSTGANKFYDLTANEPSAATIEADINAADPKNRIFPLGEFEDVDDVRAEAIFQEFGSGKKAKVRDGFRDFAGFIPNAEPLLEGKVKQSACQTIGAYIVDAGQNFIFSARKNDGIITEAYPIKIDSDTIDVMYVKATEQTIAGLMIKFQWSSQESDSYLRQIKAVDLDWGPEILNGLIDVNSDITPPTGSVDVEITMVDDYGDPVEGLLAGDMAIANLTTPGAVAIDSVTETSAGVYTIDYTTAAVGSGQELELTVTKNDYDWARVKANTWTTV